MNIEYKDLVDDARSEDITQQNNEEERNYTFAPSNTSRYISREQAFLLCFEKLFAECDFEEILDKAKLCRDLDVTEYALNLAKGVDENMAELDTLIVPFLAEKWTIDRISKVSLCLIRIAIYEILHIDTVPTNVAINEAVELSKKYSTEKDTAFVNGLLGSYAKSLESDK